MTSNQFQTLSKGQTIVYHRGDLPVDRAANTEIDKIAHEAYAAYESGHIELTQRRENISIFSYIATRQIARDDD